MKLISIFVTLLISSNLLALTIGSSLKEVSISQDNGGFVKDKVIVLFYVDPDEKDTNSHFSTKYHF